MECIRPLLPAIRNTPYGKRIQGKINREQQRNQQQQQTHHHHHHHNQHHHQQQPHTQQFPEPGISMGYLAPWMAGPSSEAGAAAAAAAAAGANDLAFFSPFQSAATFGASVPFSVFHNH